MARVQLFCEDRGHEIVARALLSRLAAELDVGVNVMVASARGGHARALDELKVFQTALRKGVVAGTPDLLVVLIDGNCSGWNDKRATIAEVIDAGLFPRFVVGCPDPHVERWCLADRVVFEDVIGTADPDPDKCERGLYKAILRNAIDRAGLLTLTDDLELAPDILKRSDLYASGKTQPSLAAFVSDLRAALKQLGGGGTVG